MNNVSASERSPENGCSLAAVPALAGEGAGATSSRSNPFKISRILVVWWIRNPSSLLAPFDDDTQELVQGAQVLETANENLAHACENTAIEDGSV
jgi:hypothetical protein